MDTDAAAALRTLKYRLLDLAHQLGPRQPESNTPREAATQMLRAVDNLLTRVRELATTLDKKAIDDAAIWDELDELLGRLVLRDLGTTADGLRAAVSMIEAKLTEAEQSLQPLVSDLQRMGRKLDEVLEQLRSRADATQRQ
jgi:hypothetical protein